MREPVLAIAAVAQRNDQGGVLPAGQLVVSRVQRHALLDDLTEPGRP